jgi:transposase
MDVCRRNGGVGLRPVRAGCGAPYVPASQRAAAAIAASPGKSDRAIAAEIGVSDFTVRKARKRTASNLAVEKRVGKDGKARKMPAAKVETFSADEFDAEDGITVDMVEQANAANRRRYFLRCDARVIR